MEIREQREQDFNDVMKGLSAHRTAQAFVYLTQQMDFRGCGKRYIRKFWTGELKLESHCDFMVFDKNDLIRARERAEVFWE